MINGIELSASLMCLNWLHAEKQIKTLEKSKIFDYLHIDIIDGKFAPDFTMGSSIINSITKSTKFNLDYHLMVYEPEKLLGTYKYKKKNKCIMTIHQESTIDLHRNLVNIRKNGFKVGLALSPGTSLETAEYVLEDVDVVNIMTVNPGYIGQPLIKQAIRKVAVLKNIIEKMKLKVKIQVDGNINLKTMPEMINAGADILVLGSTGLFIQNISLEKQIKNIKNFFKK